MKFPFLRAMLFLMTMTLSVVSLADNQVLHIWQTDGKVVSIKLDEQPITTYADGTLVITTNKTRITYPLEQVRKYTYGSQAVGIATPKIMNVMFSNDGEALWFTNLKPQTPILLYNASGQLMRCETASATGTATVSAAHFPVGVYVVKVNGATYKISKR